MKILYDVVDEETRKPICAKLNEFDRGIFNYILDTLPAVNKNASKPLAVEKTANTERKLERRPSYWDDSQDKYFSADELRKTTLECCKKALAFITMKNSISQGISTLISFDEAYENLPSTEKDCQELGSDDLLARLERLDSVRAKAIDILGSIPELPPD